MHTCTVERAHGVDCLASSMTFHEQESAAFGTKEPTPLSKTLHISLLEQTYYLDVHTRTHTHTRTLNHSWSSNTSNIIIGAYLPTFRKVEVGTFEMWCNLDYDREAIIARAKRSFRGWSHRFSRGFGGILPRENFENRDCQISIFLMFWSMILHNYCKKK